MVDWLDPAEHPVKAPKDGSTRVLALVTSGETNTATKWVEAVTVYSDGTAMGMKGRVRIIAYRWPEEVGLNDRCDSLS